MTLRFISGNSNKVKDIQTILPEIIQLDIDLPELQEFNPQKIIEDKLNNARKKYSGELICEDTSLYLTCLNGFPGPLIKWMLQTMGNQGIAELVRKYKNKKASAKTVIGYSNGKDIKFFIGEIKGTIVLPRGEDTFGWNLIFQPEGYNKTFAEMTREERNKISMRRIAAEKLKEYLETKKKLKTKKILT